MKVKILPKYVFDDLLKKENITDENVEEFKNTAFISIISSGEFEKSYLKENHKNYLSIKFDDLSNEEYEKYKLSHNEKHELILFSEEQADEIINFIYLTGAKQIIVHCSAGVSRSGAVGTFINDCFKGQDYFGFIKDNPFIKPNSYILNTLRKTLELRP